jgi:predicted O-methyltransferase YrrM
MKKENKLKKTLKGLMAIVRNPWLLNHVLSDNSVWGRQIEKKYGIRGGLKTVDITTLFPGFRETIDTFAFLDGGSSPLDLSLIRGLCKTMPNCAYFEIGTCRGESVANVADVCSKCYTLDLPPELYTDKAEGSLVAYFSKNIKNVTQLWGDSTKFDYAGLGMKFDVIFIDGDHRYEFVQADTANVFKHLVHENSIVIWHDYATDVVYPRNEVFAGILDGVPASLHSNLYHVSNTICAIYINKQFPILNTENSRIPNKKFKLSLESVSLPDTH